MIFQVGKVYKYTNYDGGVFLVRIIRESGSGKQCEVEVIESSGSGPVAGTVGWADKSSMSYA